jgi:hypothetical protein
LVEKEILASEIFAFQKSRKLAFKDMKEILERSEIVKSKNIEQKLNEIRRNYLQKVFLF